MAGQQRKETISSRVSAQLRDDILRGQLAPGSKINLDRLRERFDISISPLREAVSRLAADGLVEFEDQRGYRVAPVSIENLVEISLLRLELNLLAFQASIEQGDLEWESIVMRTLYILKKTERDENRSETIEAWNTAYADFQTALIQGCKMPMLLNFCAIIQNLSQRYQNQCSSVPVRLDKLEDIASAATSRNSGDACSLLKAHILSTDIALRQSLASQFI